MFVCIRSSKAFCVYAYVNDRQTHWYRYGEIGKLITFPEKYRLKHGDYYGFCVDMIRSRCEVFLNGKSLGVLSKRVPKRIIPAVSNNGAAPFDGIFTIRPANY